MTPQRGLEATAQALALALYDAFTTWRQQECPNEPAEVAYSLWVRAVDLHASYRPGQRGWATVTVQDRRPGRTYQEVYHLEPRPNKTQLRRARNEA